MNVHSAPMRTTASARKSLINRIFSTIEGFRRSFRVSWSKMLYFNQRSMPFSVAVKLPVYIYNHTQFSSPSGRVEIMRGCDVVTPDDLIVASSCSLPSKDYAGSVGPHSVVGGISARVLKTDVRRIFNRASETSLHSHYTRGHAPFVLDVEAQAVDSFCVRPAIRELP